MLYPLHLSCSLASIPFPKGVCGGMGGIATPRFLLQLFFKEKLRKMRLCKAFFRIYGEMCRVIFCGRLKDSRKECVQITFKEVARGSGKNAFRIGDPVRGVIGTQGGEGGDHLVKTCGAFSAVRNDLTVKKGRHQRLVIRQDAEEGFKGGAESDSIRFGH